MLLKNQVIKWGNGLEKSHLYFYVRIPVHADRDSGVMATSVPI